MLYAFEEYVLDTAFLELRFRGDVRHLQPKPLDLLHHLIVHRNRLVLKEELLSQLWPGVTVTENALAQAVACVRKALAEASAPPIVSVRARGYRFALEVRESEPPPALAAPPTLVSRVSYVDRERRRAIVIGPAHPAPRGLAPRR